MNVKKVIKKLPLGYSEVIYLGVKYGLTRTDFNNGKSVKVFAKELGGRDFISFNYYETKQNKHLKPCEMSKEKVLSFLEGMQLLDRSVGK